MSEELHGYEIAQAILASNPRIEISEEAPVRLEVNQLVVDTFESAAILRVDEVTNNEGTKAVGTAVANWASGGVFIPFYERRYGRRTGIEINLDRYMRVVTVKGLDPTLL